MEGFIDIHCHCLSEVDDGAKTMEDSLAMLSQAYADGIRAVIVTPHVHYRRGQVGKAVIEQKLEQLFSGKIITGIEIKCVYHKTRIEVLGYKYDLDKMSKWVNEFYKDKSKEKLQKKYFDKTYSVCEQLGF